MKVINLLRYYIVMGMAFIMVNAVLRAAEPSSSSSPVLGRTFVPATEPVDAKKPVCYIIMAGKTDKFLPLAESTELPELWD